MGLGLGLGLLNIIFGGLLSYVSYISRCPVENKQKKRSLGAGTQVRAMVAYGARSDSCEESHPARALIVARGAPLPLAPQTCPQSKKIVKNKRKDKK